MCLGVALGLGPRSKFLGYQLVGVGSKNKLKEYTPSWSGTHISVAIDPKVADDIARRVRSK